MRILITGASGLLGSALQPVLAAAGHECVLLQRGGEDGAGPRWDPERGRIHLEPATPIHAVVHLAGENVGSRWTDAKKHRIRSSRVEGTKLLCHALTQLASPPKKLISMSGAGFYGNRGSEILDEQSRKGSGFLADVCQAWEGATDEAEAAGIGVLHLRSGVVLTTRGGALARMLPAFRLGLGGRLGDGQQVWSWIALSDFVAIVRWLLESNASIRGPVNVAAPHSVTNETFTKVLGRVLHRPAFATVPAPALRLIFGEMADEALLASACVVPRVLQEHGFEFQFPTLEPTLRSLLRHP